MSVDFKSLLEELSEMVYEVYCTNLKRCLGGMTIKDAKDIINSAKDRIKAIKENRAQKKKEQDEEKIAKLTDKEKSRLVIEEKEETVIDGKTVDEIVDENSNEAQEGNTMIENYMNELGDQIKEKMKTKKEEIEKDIKTLFSNLKDIIKETASIPGKIIAIPNSAISTGPLGASVSAGNAIKGFQDLKTTCDNIASKIDSIRMICFKYENEVKNIANYFKDVEDEDGKKVNEKLEKVKKTMEDIKKALSTAQTAISVLGSIPKLKEKVQNIAGVPEIVVEGVTDEEIKEAEDNAEVKEENVTPPTPYNCMGCTNVKLNNQGEFTEEELDLYVNYIGKNKEPEETADINWDLYEKLKTTIKDHVCKFNACKFCFSRHPDDYMIDEWKENPEDSDTIKGIKNSVVNEWKDEDTKLGTFCKNNTNRK